VKAAHSRQLALLLLISWCVTLIALRVFWSGRLSYVFLVWNLILAIIPVIAASTLRRVMTDHSLSVRAVLLMMVWLLFLPNAPYLATDLIHLRSRPFVPLWYDLALLLSCAVTGVILGYVSLADVHRILRTRLSTAAAWTINTVVLFLCAFGIYLGRYQRWNSWHIITDPGALLADISGRVLHPFAHLRTVTVTVIYGLALCVGYVVFHLLFVADNEPADHNIRPAHSRL